MADVRIAGTLMISEEGDLLLQRRDNLPHVTSPGMLSLFGGHCEGYETLLETAVRELKEETGVVTGADTLSLMTEMVTTYSNGNSRQGGFFLLRNINPNTLVVTEGHLEIVERKNAYRMMSQMVPTTCFIVSLFLQSY